MFLLLLLIIPRFTSADLHPPEKAKILKGVYGNVVPIFEVVQVV